MEIPFKSHGIRGKETRSWSPVSQCWALRAPATRSGGDAEGWSKLDHPLGLLGILGRSKLELVFVVGKSWENLWETMGKALNVWKIIHRSWENMVVYWENHHVRTIYHKLTTQKWERFIAHIYGDLGDGLWHCFTHMTEIVGKYGTTPLHLWRFMAIEESSG